MFSRPERAQVSKVGLGHAPLPPGKFEHETPGYAFSCFLGHENGNFPNQKC